MKSGQVVQVVEVLNARATARKAYELVLVRLTELEVAKNVICLLLWLETIMGIEVLDKVTAMAPGDILFMQAITEVSIMYNYILDGCPPPMPLKGIPTIAALCSGGPLVEFRFFKFHKGLVARGITVIRDSIGALVFNDNLHTMLHQFKDDARTLPAPELMVPFVPMMRTPPEDSRTVFLALPECPCHRPSTQDIVNYFEQTLKFGPCIKRVEMEQPSAGQAPKHGIIVFMSAEQRDEAMFEETAIFFRVEDHDIWVQLYMPLL